MVYTEEQDKDPFTELKRSIRDKHIRDVNKYLFYLKQWSLKQNNRAHSYTIATIRSRLQFLLSKGYRIGPNKRPNGALYWRPNNDRSRSIFTTSTP